MSIKQTISDLHYYAELNNGKCLSKEYWDQITLYEWRCDKGHRFSMAYVFIKQGAWCPECRIKKKRRLELETLQAVAAEKGGRCLSTIYVNNYSKLKWQCAQGHRWEAKAMHIKSGNSWCPDCSGKRKHTIEQMAALAKSKGGLCLSKSYKNNETLLEWRCKKGHEWKAKAVKVLTGQWCPVCRYTTVAEKLRTDIKKIQKLATDRGGKLLTKEYINAHQPLKWKCKHGHTWMIRRSDVIRRGWCPVCKEEKK